RRESYSNLSIDDFKRLFSSFCLLTYFERKISFSEVELIDYVRRAIEMEDITVEPAQFINDLFMSVCLLQRAGIEVSFFHRSFQEYFCSLVLLRNQDIDLNVAVTRIITEEINSSIIPMLAQMNLARLEQEWVLPWLTNFLSRIGKANLRNSPS